MVFNYNIILIFCKLTSILYKIYYIIKIGEFMKIYILLTYTGTILSRVVKYYTHSPYGHVSISLDKDLKELYSFGRINPYNPFKGGFVHEGIDIGTFKRFKNTRCEIYELDVSIDQYNKLKDIINYINNNKEKYHFNVIGLFSQPFHYKRKKHNYFYCSEFVKYCLEHINYCNLPELCKPDDFRLLNNSKLIYSGKLRKYK